MLFAVTSGKDVTEEERRDAYSKKGFIVAVYESVCTKAREAGEIA